MIPIVIGIAALVMIGLAVRALIRWARARPPQSSFVPLPQSPRDTDNVEPLTFEQQQIALLQQISKRLQAVNIVAIIVLITWAAGCILFTASSIITAIIGTGIIAALQRALQEFAGQ